MKTVRFNCMLAVILAGIAIALAGCRGAGETNSPVELVATIEQELHVIDFTDPDCGDLGTVILRALQKRETTPGVEPTFLDVKLTAYRVSYRRTDGGTLVPSPFTRSISMLVPVGGTATSISMLVPVGGAATGPGFLAFEQDALSKAPFAALLPQNGGVDPETGRQSVTMEVRMDVFGETLSGENVFARATSELTFCVGCGGCV